MNDLQHWFLDALPIAVFESDGDGHCRFLSEGWTRITGIGVEECLGRPFDRFIHPDDLLRFHDYLDQTLASPGDEKADTFRYINDDGEYVWLECHARSLAQRDGDDLVVAGTLTNISDRVDEESLLMARHRTLSGMMNDLPGMAYRCRNNADWTMEFVSAGSLALTGYSPRDIIDNNLLSYGRLIHPDDSDMVWSEVQRGIRENRRFEIHYRIVTANGRIKWVWENGKGVYSPSKELLGIEGFITEIKIDTDQRGPGPESGSLYDPQTGTPTLALFLDRIDHFRAAGDIPGAHAPFLLCIHLEHFESLTESSSPEALSSAHREISQRLRSSMAERDSLCKLSNGRYAVFVEQPSMAVADWLASVKARFVEPLPIEDRSIFVELSAGAAGHLHGRPASMSLDAAITALNHARGMGSRRVITEDAAAPARTAEPGRPPLERRPAGA